ncbi:MAG: discoidin domain-containing protein [Bacteroidales bacterium]|nr:discoidin domain-containing protein [Bacteroidales bacterium]
MKKIYTTLILASIVFFNLNAQINLATNGANASASDEISGGEAALAFDEDSTTGWVVTSSPVQWIRYDFGESVLVNGYAMHYLVDSIPGFQPVSWTLEGSTDGSSWTPLDTVTDNAIFAEWEEFETFNQVSYQYYRMNITAAGADTLAIGDLRLYVISAPTVVTGEANYITAELASCSGTVVQSGGTPVLQRGICYNTVGNPSLGDSWHTSSAGIGSYNTLLVNLSPNTTYYFRAFASNSVGISYAAQVKAFTTSKLTQEITFAELENETYGVADFDPAASASSGLTVTYTSSNNEVATIIANQVHVIGAGSTLITAMQNGNSTYNAADPIEQSLTIEKLKIQAIADNMSKVYGTENPFFTISYSGFVNADDAGDLDVEPAAISEAGQYSSAGSYFITPTEGSDNNYSFEYVAGYLTVTKAPLDLIVSNSAREYGEENPEFSWIYSGFLNGDDITGIDALPEGSTTATLTSDVGIYPITLVNGGDNNYEFVIAEGSLEITKAPLSASADDKVKTYGEPNPELTCSFSGFKNDDQVLDLDSIPYLYTPADETSVVGEYSIAIRPFNDKNYELSFGEGILTVEQAFLNASVEDLSRFEGDPNPEFVIQYSGFVNDDTAVDIDEAPVATCIADETTAPGNYAIEVSGGSDDNYFILTYNGLLTVIEKPDALNEASGNMLRIYPNPVSETLYFEGEFRNADVMLTTLGGSVILNRKLSDQGIDLRAVPAGIYLVRVVENEQVLLQGKININR